MLLGVTQEGFLGSIVAAPWQRKFQYVPQSPRKTAVLPVFRASMEELPDAMDKKERRHLAISAFAALMLGMSAKRLHGTIAVAKLRSQTHEAAHSTQKACTTTLL